MPNSIENTIRFLETQWSSITNNKIKGIEAEVRFEELLQSADYRDKYQYIIPGGWIITPNNMVNSNLPAKDRIAIIPIPSSFDWSGQLTPHSFVAQICANSYFQQAKIKVFFAKIEDEMSSDLENTFRIPEKGNYHRDYPLSFFKVGENGLVHVDEGDVMEKFGSRNGLRGMRAYPIGRIDRTTTIWTQNEIVVKLFWKEYVRYYLQRMFLVSNNDLDFFIVGNSGKSYPVEFKSKSVVEDSTLGDWFGIDVSPFAKLAYFTSLSNNMDAIYVVEEVIDGQDNLWWGIKFSELLQGCNWVVQGGGTGMMGGSSSTIKVPKSILLPLDSFLETL